MELGLLSGLTAGLAISYSQLKSLVPETITVHRIGQVGADGTLGLTGPTGPIGHTGTVGPQGAYGMRGLAGPTGPSPRGHIGLSGSVGATGPIGATGAIAAVGTYPAYGRLNQGGATSNMTFSNDTSSNFTLSLARNTYYLLVGSYTISSLSAFPSNAVIETRFQDSVATGETYSQMILPEGRTLAVVPFSELVLVTGGTVTLTSTAMKNPILVSYPDGSLQISSGSVTVGAISLAEYP